MSIYHKAKILITGGGGYLGSKLAAMLLEYDCTIWLLDIAFNPFSLSLAEHSDKVFYVHCDICDSHHLSQVCNEISPSIVYHFGGLLDRERDFSLYHKLYKVNVEGTLNLLTALRNVGYDRFFFSSSSEVYGNIESPYNEDQVPNPVSPYSLTKLMAESLIKTYSSLYVKPYTIARIFNFYGEDQPQGFFFRQLIDALYNDEAFRMTKGEQKRDFSHVNAVLEMIINLTSSIGSNNQIVNICSGKSIAIKDLAYEIAQTKGKEDLLLVGALPYRDNEVWDMMGDNAKYNSIVGAKR